MLAVLQHKKYHPTLAGGLGNQMLQYALHLSLKDQGFQSTLYLKESSLDQHNGLEIYKLFANCNEKAISTQRLDRSLRRQAEIIRFANLFRTTLIDGNRFSRLPYYPREFLNFPKWSSYIWPLDLVKELQSIFIFPEFKDDKNANTALLIENKESVSIHIRRGDFISTPEYKIQFGGLCETSYYQSAIQHMLQHIEKPSFVVFSDDIEWARKNLSLESALFVDWNIGEDSFRDMQLMSRCKHNIIANSTFSYMGALLNKNREKIVIAPKKWTRDHNEQLGEKLLRPEWITIDNDQPLVVLKSSTTLKDRDLKRLLRQSYKDFALDPILLPKGHHMTQKFRAWENATNEHNLEIDLRAEDLKQLKNRHFIRDRIIRQIA